MVRGGDSKSSPASRPVSNLAPPARQAWCRSRLASCEILEGGEIRSSTFSEGDAGRVAIEADRLLIRGDSPEFFTGIANSAEPGSSGDAGDDRIVAGELEILAGGAITSGTASER